MLSQSATERFWGKIDRSDSPDACWPWIAFRPSNGYGLFWLAGKLVLAHRVAYELDRGHPPPLERPFICHHCDTPSCCNARHLFSGTQADNIADAKAKGRLATGAQNGAHTRPDRRPHGARHGRAKLTEQQVREIRQRCAIGETQRMVAREFGVSQKVIWNIVHRNTWVHI